MTFEDVQNSVNQWLWNKDEQTYFWILNAEPETKIIEAKGLGGLKTKFFFSSERFFKHTQKI